MSKESPVHNGGMVEIKGEKMNSGSPRSNPRAGGPVIFNDRIAAIESFKKNSGIEIKNHEFRDDTHLTLKEDKTRANSFKGLIEEDSKKGARTSSFKALSMEEKNASPRTGSFKSFANNKKVEISKERIASLGLIPVDKLDLVPDTKPETAKDGLDLMKKSLSSSGSQSRIASFSSHTSHTSDGKSNEKDEKGGDEKGGDIKDHEPRFGEFKKGSITIFNPASLVARLAEYVSEETESIATKRKQNHDSSSDSAGTMAYQVDSLNTHDIYGGKTVFGKSSNFGSVLWKDSSSSTGDSSPSPARSDYISTKSQEEALKAKPDRLGSLKWAVDNVIVEDATEEIDNFVNKLLAKTPSETKPNVDIILTSAIYEAAYLEAASSPKKVTTRNTVEERPKAKIAIDQIYDAIPSLGLCSNTFHASNEDIINDERKKEREKEREKEKGAGAVKERNDEDDEYLLTPPEMRKRSLISIEGKVTTSEEGCENVVKEVVKYEHDFLHAKDESEKETIKHQIPLRESLTKRLSFFMPKSNSISPLPANSSKTGSRSKSMEKVIMKRESSNLDSDSPTDNIGGSNMKTRRGSQSSVSSLLSLNRRESGIIDQADEEDNKVKDTRRSSIRSSVSAPTTIQSNLRSSMASVESIATTTSLPATLVAPAKKSQSKIKFFVEEEKSAHDTDMESLEKRRSSTSTSPSDNLLATSGGGGRRTSLESTVTTLSTHSAVELGQQGKSNKGSKNRLGGRKDFSERSLTYLLIITYFLCILVMLVKELAFT